MPTLLTLNLITKNKDLLIHGTFPCDLVFRAKDIFFDVPLSVAI